MSIILHLSLLCIFVLGSSIVPVSGETFEFVVGCTTSAMAPGTRGFQNRGLIRGFDYWSNVSQNFPPLIIDGKQVVLKFDLREDGGNITLMKNHYIDMVADPGIHFLMGPVNRYVHNMLLYSIFQLFNYSIIQLFNCSIVRFIFHVNSLRI